MNYRILAFTIFAVLMMGQARAENSTTANIVIPVSPAIPKISITFSPDMPKSVACDAAAGTWISTVSTSGGDGNPISLSMLPGGDFALSGNDIVVGPNGIAPPDCGVSQAVSVTATQQ